MRSSHPALYLAFSMLLTVRAHAQPAPDVLVFVNGDKLAGHVERATGASVVFKSDMAGELTIDWSKIQELRSAQKFAVIPKHVRLRGSQDAAGVPQGTIVMTAQQIQIAAATPQTVAVGNVGNIVDQASFERALTRSSFLHGWRGGATGGLSLTEATQKSQTFSAAVNLVRTVPSENWMDKRSRTTFDFNQAYGKLTQPGSPAVKTSLYHLGLEQGWFFSPRLFAFGQAVLDHSFSQGLSLQQTYGGGLGVVVVQRAHQELDFKASADYINQRFNAPGRNKRLIGSIFGETYLRTMTHGIVLNEQAGFTPAWNEPKAYSAFASAALTFPVYRRLGLTLGTLDNFLNDPPPGFKKNSFQFTAGATYSFQ